MGPPADVDGHEEWQDTLVGQHTMENQWESPGMYMGFS